MTSPIVRVVRQDGDRVLVSLPLEGFPEGFEVQPGTLVVVYERGEEGVARPLVREIVVQQPLSETDEQLLGGSGERLLTQGVEAFEVQPATVRDSAGGPPYVVTVLERTGPQVVSVRSMSQESL